mmetsp:Transcript_36278/g.95052  ORF Transcript_36278/g.95052 Transcript_36278/m.95052 type:complete len:116 (+) Transcript_36278:2449-2796(+)
MSRSRMEPQMRRNIMAITSATTKTEMAPHTEVVSTTQLIFFAEGEHDAQAAYTPNPSRCELSQVSHGAVELLAFKMHCPQRGSCNTHVVTAAWQLSSRVGKQKVFTADRRFRATG